MDMVKTYKLPFDEFLEISKHINADDTMRAERIFQTFMLGKRNLLGKHNDRFILAWAYAALFMAGRISGIRAEREKRRKKAATAS